MTTPTPNGRVSAKVYARRRATVLGVLLFVILLIVLLVWRPWSGSGDEVAAPETPNATSVPSPEPTSVATDECDPKAIVVTAITDRSTYAAGQKPELKLSIANTGDVACTLNVGTAAQVFTISSGDEKYWTSTDCQSGASDQESSIAPGQTVTSSSAITWDRSRSAEDTCASARPRAPANGASYHLNVSIDGIEGTNSKQFILG